jgi:hypothetical protein
MQSTRRVFIAIAAPLSSILNACAPLERAAEDLLGETGTAQQYYDRKKAEFEDQAKNGKIYWVDAAKLTRDVDRSLAGRGRWKFDSNDEEYHAYCILLAEQLDGKRISFTYFDALRTARFNQIQERRRPR